MKCNRKSCLNEDARWFNHSTRAYYCESCATHLNKLHHEEAMQLYGHELCVLEKAKPRMVSPNEMLEAAKQDMLQGRHPRNREDWLRIMNFMVVNCQLGLRFPACRLMNKILDMGLSDEDITGIIEFHQPFAVQISIRTGEYTVTDGSGLMAMKPNMNEFIVMGKMDTRKEAEDFCEHCQNHPRRQIRFAELLALLG